MSLKTTTTTTPTISSAALRIGAALSAIWISRPSRAISSVWLASPMTVPRAMTSSTGLATRSRVFALTMFKTCSSCKPNASSTVHPVICSAARFMRVIRPAGSVAMTASPIECSVMARFSSLRRSFSALTSRSASEPARSVRMRSSVAASSPISSLRVHASAWSSLPWARWRASCCSARNGRMMRRRKRSQMMVMDTLIWATSAMPISARSRQRPFTTRAVDKSRSTRPTSSPSK